MDGVRNGRERTGHARMRWKKHKIHAINWISGLAAKKNIKEQIVGMTQSRGYYKVDEVRASCS